MDIDVAIKKLNAFKKLSSSIGECDLVQLNDDSFVVKIPFGSPPESHTHVVGFCPTPKRKKCND